MTIAKGALALICIVGAILGCLLAISFVLHTPILRDIIVIWLGIVIALGRR